VVNIDVLYVVSIWLLPVLIAVTFHEAAHGYVARFLGDDTASRLGRVSLNPFRHIDPFGTILLPGLLLLARSPFLFGYAKPVPINFRALRSPRAECLDGGSDAPHERQDDDDDPKRAAWINSPKTACTPNNCCLSATAPTRHACYSPVTARGGRGRG
jgi:hypothetical protein